MEIDFGQYGAGSAARGAHTERPSGERGIAAQKIEKTGHHETVAGHDCEDWNVTDMATGQPAFGLHGERHRHIRLWCYGGRVIRPRFLSKRGFSDSSTFPIKFVEFDAVAEARSLA